MKNPKENFSEILDLFQDLDESLFENQDVKDFNDFVDRQSEQSAMEDMIAEGFDLNF